MLMLKKQQEMAKTVSEALVALVEQAHPNAVGGRISVYA